ncbi:DUF4445 domain-containing protein [Acetobacterium paludosum]|uniref:DUF4445 domain-containing protein n=1 Tax=Acetobacterium paludosum TaxID=52693 RepID=A0A923I101_9FIRM|nr:ASKHA domain-containing protein [Acetobacterium paludosum]MBC3889706.1 DUF4445 domain-containing protein [Acetobacterium paludosum]
MPRIIIKNGADIDRVYECDPEDNLYHFMTGLNLIDAPCGGVGCCGKCKVKILEGNVIPADAEKEFFSEQETAAGWRLACLHTVKGELTLELEPEEVIGEIISKGFLKEFTKKPYISKHLDELGNTLVMAGNEVIDREVGDTRNRLFGLAIDIGTTTVVAALIDMSNGRELSSMSCLNGQKIFGQDVITRINYAMIQKNGTLIQQKTILTDLKNLIAKIIAECHREYDLTANDIYEVTVGGNTTMIHLLAGIDPSSMGTAPYTPGFRGPLILSGINDLQLPVSKNCLVYCLPSVSAFVGGDITAGILACSIQQNPGNILFIDIGTNGEMVLSKGGKLSACSCAAGPALEGMNISCGMRAANGSIEEVKLRGDGADISVAISVIGNEKPKGLCGSGLLSAVAELNRTGILRKSGRLLDHPLVEKVAGKKHFIIDQENDIYLTQQDIRQVQLAKGAILSGIQAMVQANEMTFGEINQVMVAGQFGANLKAESLTGAGLIPSELEDVITYVGNTSKSGAYLCLLSTEERATGEKIVDEVSYIELSRLAGYEKLFIKAMKF